MDGVIYAQDLIGSAFNPLVPPTLPRGVVTPTDMEYRVAGLASHPGIKHTATFAALSQINRTEHIDALQ